MSLVSCSNCRRLFPGEGTPYRCPVCGGAYDLPQLPEYDEAALARTSNQPGIWRFGPLLGVEPAREPISLGEGSTPLVWGQAGGRSVAFKLEYLNPSGSFKDRGSAVLVQLLVNRGCQTVLEDSSGNAGASLAAYAARAGIKAKIYIPDGTPGPKRRQIEAHQAELVQVMGGRANAAEAAGRAVDSMAETGGGAAYASHTWLPHGLAGYATLGYELVEQLGQTPGTVVLPAGQGGLLLGLGRGFEALQRAGRIDFMPRIIAVQARACAPLWAVYQFGTAGMSWVTDSETLADAVRVKYPLRGDAVLSWLESHDGLVLAVEENEILPGVQALAAQGFYVEPTSALVWNALKQIQDQAPEPVVAVLTGSGLKN